MIKFPVVDNTSRHFSTHAGSSVSFLQEMLFLY